MSAEGRLDQNAADPRFLGNVLLKALALFALLNLLFALAEPLPPLGRLSAYNLVFPGRARLPWSENPSKAYNLSLFNLEAMFASHELDGSAKAPDEFRVLVFGDSSAWGFLLTPDETLTGALNAAKLTTADGQRVRAYNLGYPTISLTKDLLLMDAAMRYRPDLIVWLATLESFPYEKQIFTPLVQHNPGRVRQLIRAYSLNLDPDDAAFVEPGLWGRTIVGQRRALADLLRLQLYGALWAATGIDQDIPESYTPRQEDLEADESYYGLEPPLTADEIAFDVLAAGVAQAGETPVLIVNEPMFVSQGENSDIRYNFFYPRWAYDAYRGLLAEQAAAKGWHYRDFWDIIPASEFTNTAIHLTPAGTQALAAEVGEAILDLANEPLTASTPNSE